MSLKVSTGSEAHRRTEEISMSLLSNGDNYAQMDATRGADDDDGAHLPQWKQTLLQRQNKFRSKNFDTHESATWVKDMRDMSRRQHIIEGTMQWVVAFFIGVGTAVVAWLIDFFIRTIVGIKFGMILDGKTLPGMGVATPVILYIAINMFLCGIASGFVNTIETVAAGSGIPEIKAELNGVKMDRVLNMKTLVVKATGVLFSVAGGLPIGKEGPMIHSGAILGAGVSQGKGSFPVPFQTAVHRHFRNDVAKRDFIACGAAAGVSAAFGAPIGGVLFAVEEGASFWSIPLTWKSFLSAVTATYVLNILISLTEPSRAGKFVGVLDNPGVVEFGTFGGQQETPWRVGEIPLFILLGILLGLGGAIFNGINTWLTKFRMRYIPTPNRLRRWLEILALSVVISTVGVCIPLLFSKEYSCIATSEAGQDPKVIAGLRTFYCEGDTFNQVATLFFTQSEAAILQLFHSTLNFGLGQLFLFFLFYFLLACVIYGTAVPSGLFVPSLTAGAAFGRFYGQVLHLFLPGISSPGSYALMGAAGMLGGMARITISATVIIIESTNNVSYALPVMLTILCSKWVGDLFNKGLYDIHNDLKGVPFLETDPPHEIYDISLKDIMRKLPPPVSVPAETTVGAVVEMLKRYPYSAFPVVSDEAVVEGVSGVGAMISPGPHGEGHTRGRLVGMISRHRLNALLQLKAYARVGMDDHNTPSSPLSDGVCIDTERLSEIVSEEEITRAYPHYLDISAPGVCPPQADFHKFFDLTPYYAPSPTTIAMSAPAVRAYRLFRTLGMRHLVIVDVHHTCVGVLTRKWLTEPALESLHHEVHENGTAGSSNAGKHL